ncbi:hypothetical protein GUJ93_ZPchr0011g28578 [Zizania palustris]|uniref:Uncharacterized protein n=1 Tax=Zizania palustris TaxID=103762 RepID=A0A8J5WLX8_ZIZPA|nr:hypothetical protein GUJ93_ZPchr0011g28578 [Zizania palustris]
MESKPHSKMFLRHRWSSPPRRGRLLSPEHASLKLFLSRSRCRRLRPPPLFFCTGVAWIGDLAGLGLTSLAGL